MTDRPTFINTCGERRRQEQGFEIDDLEERYITAFASRYVYEGLPEGCPRDFIERTLYMCGGVSGKKVRGLGPTLLGITVSVFSVYGYPQRWRAIAILGELSTSVSDSLQEESRNPVLWDRVSMHERVQPYLEVMRKAMNALNVNLVGLTNPVLVEASPGMELNGRIIKNNLTAGDVYIPVIDKGAIGASVLDLKAQDHTANLLGVIHDMDGEILDLMGIRSSLEKASGISVEEASASEMQINQQGDLDLIRRREWLEKLNAVLGTNITVRPADTGERADDAPADDEAEDGSEEVNS